MNKTKIKPKLMLGTVVAILIFSLLPGALAAKSTKLDFGAIGDQRFFALEDFWIEDGVIHMKFYKENNLTGYIDESPFIGYTEEYFYAKQNIVTGKMVVNGKAKFNILYKGQEGTFYGPINAKIVAGVMDTKFTLQGAGYFEGMKLFGKAWIYNVTANEMSGTILIPN